MGSSPRLIASLSAVKLLSPYVQTVIVNTNEFPSKIGVQVVDHLGKEVTQKQVKVTGTAKRVKSSKDSTFGFTKKNGSSFEATNIETTGAGVYKISIEVDLGNEHKFTETVTVHLEGSVKFVDPSFTGGAVSFKLKVDGQDSDKQVEHAFVEYRHTSDSNAVFVDSENTFISGKYLFKRVLVGKHHPEGDYDIFVGVTDQSISTTHTQKVATHSNKKGTKEYKPAFSGKPEYTTGTIIENIFEPEVDYNAQYTIPMFVFFGLHAAVLLWYLQKAMTSTVKVKASGYMAFLLFIPIVLFFWLFWTQINILQAFAVIGLSVPYLAFVLWM